VKRSARAQEFGWDDDAGGILMVPKDLAKPTGDGENLLDNYGSIDLSKIRAFEEQYLHLEIRPAQDSYMMWKCLMNSISVAAGNNKITIWKDQYNVQDRASCNLLLKIIARESASRHRSISHASSLENEAKKDHSSSPEGTQTRSHGR
jgi:hypothetical protein